MVPVCLGWQSCLRTVRQTSRLETMRLPPPPQRRLLEPGPQGPQRPGRTPKCAEGDGTMTTSAQETPTTTVPSTDLGAIKLGLVERYQQVRHFTEQLCEPLVTEDYVIQSMPDVSPTKWHIAHVSWFFETFLLTWADPEYPSYHPRFAYLFNSYYNAVGPRHCGPKRGLISRPTVEETYAYRGYADQNMLR